MASAQMQLAHDASKSATHALQQELKLSKAQLQKNADELTRCRRALGKCQSVIHSGEVSRRIVVIDR